jgi:hypothetical protein
MQLIARISSLHYSVHAVASVGVRVEQEQLVPLLM